MYDVVALGELLVDFTPLGNRSFQANPGGAPANVLAACARLGLQTAFLGKVGEDDFGRMLMQDLQNAGVDASGLLFTQEAPTTLAFVQLDSDGDRSFTLVRKPGADMLYTPEEINYTILNSARAFHFGSVSLTHSPSRDATLAAAAYAKEKGLIVSYDPNLCPLLWTSLEEAKEIIPQGFAYADIIKMSEEELEFLMDTKDKQVGAEQLHKLGVSLVFITLGSHGCYFSSQSACGYLPTFDLPVVDTTGAGDGFMGGILYSVLESGLSPAELGTRKVPLANMAEFANAVGSLITTKKGGLLSMPTIQQVRHCMQSAKKLILPSS